MMKVITSGTSFLLIVYVMLRDDAWDVMKQILYPIGPV